MKTKQKWREKVMTILFFSVFAGAPLLLSYVLVNVVLNGEIQGYWWGLYILFWVVTILLLHGVTYRILRVAPRYWNEM